MVDREAVAWEDPVVTWTADLEGEERLANRWGTFFVRFIWPIFGLARSQHSRSRSSGGGPIAPT
jgi:hypothetical protein